MQPGLIEYDVGKISTVLLWIGASGSTVGVTFQSGNRYELADVRRDVWAGFVATYNHALAWSRSGRYERDKPHAVSLTRFYKNEVEDFFPRWKVDPASGHCTPHNDLAGTWEATNGPRGASCVHACLTDRFGRRGARP